MMDSPVQMDVDQPLQTPAPPQLDDEELPAKIMHSHSLEPLTNARNGTTASLGSSLDSTIDISTYGVIGQQTNFPDRLSLPRQNGQFEDCDDALPISLRANAEMLHDPTDVHEGSSFKHQRFQMLAENAVAETVLMQGLQQTTNAEMRELGPEKCLLEREFSQMPDPNSDQGHVESVHPNLYPPLQQNHQAGVIVSPESQVQLASQTQPAPAKVVSERNCLERVQQSYQLSYDPMEARTPISSEVKLVLEETVQRVETNHISAGQATKSNRKRNSTTLCDFGGRNIPEQVEVNEVHDIDFTDEMPSSPEPDDEAETLIDDFVEDFTSEDKRILFSEEAYEGTPIKEVIVQAKMDDEVAEVLRTYTKSQFGELRKRAAIHVMASDERIAAYQSDLRKMSVPLLKMAQQLEESSVDDVEELRRATGNVLCLMLMLNERMLHDRRRAILNFFERPDDMADEHRLPRRPGDGLFGKRFCWLNGLGFTKRRPRRKPAPRVVYQPAPAAEPPQTAKVKMNAVPTAAPLQVEPLTEQAFAEEFDEEFEDDEEEGDDEDWKVSEDEEDVDPEEEEVDEDEDDDDEIHSEVGDHEDQSTKPMNGSVSENGENHTVDEIWNESMRLMQLADAAVEGVNAKRKIKTDKKKTKRKLKKDKLKKAKKESKKRVLKETSGVSPVKQGRKKKVKDSTPPLASLDAEETTPKKRRRKTRPTKEDHENSAAYKRRKKDGPTIERKIDPHCEHCDFEADRRHLIMHVRKVHPDKMIQCDQCNKKFAFNVSLWNHVVIMHGSAKFKCDQCTRSFRSEEKLRMHSFMHSENKPFACEICGKGCLTKRHLDAHVLIHEQRQQLYCQMCDRHFATNHNYRNHMKLHTGQKDFFCDICNAGFPIKARLTQHKRLHHSGEQYVCDVCGKAFKARHILNDHKALRHSNEKAWVCEICGAGFKLKSVLVRHLKTHSDERPYRCDICEKAFKDRSTLGVHRKTHSTDRPFLCEQCGMSFKRNAERKKHNCIGRMVQIPDDSSQSHQSQIVGPNVIGSTSMPHAGLGPSHISTNPHIGTVAHLGVANHSAHHTIVTATHRSIPLTTLVHHHPHSTSTLMSSGPATPGTSLQAQIMQLLDEGLHAAGGTHQAQQPQQQQQQQPQQQQQQQSLHHAQQTGNFSVN